MATTINAGNATSGAAISADTTGILQLQSGSTPTTAVTINASQQVGIGITTPATILNAYNATSAIISVDGDSQTQFRERRYSTDGNSPFFNFGKARGTLASPTAVTSGDNAGVTQYQGYDGAAFRTVAQVSGTVETYTGSDNISGSISFATRPTGAAGVVAEQMRITSAGLLQFNSGYGSVVTAYGCRAWVNFNGTGTVAIRGSGNVGSITDNGTGDYTVNFTTAMPDVNYSVSSTGPSIANGGGAFQVAQNTATAPTVSAYRINVQSTSGTMNDNAFVQLAFFR